MAQEDFSKNQLLQSALELIEMQNDEIERLRKNLSRMTDTSREHLSDTSEASEKTSEIEHLLQQSNEGLSQALIVLSSLRENISRIDKAANKAIKNFSDIGFSETNVEDIKILADTLDEAVDSQLIDEHEDYIKNLRARIIASSKK